MRGAGGTVQRHLGRQLQLNGFWFDATDLCEPADPVFQDWLAGIASVNSTDLVCKPGDCNYDHLVDAGDISASVLEIFDGDGSDPAAATGGTFPGTSLCDANEDGTIDAGDLSCTVLLIFNGPGACGGPAGQPDAFGK